MRKYGPYEPLDVLVKQKNATIYRAIGRAMPAAGTFVSVVASVAVIVTMMRTPWRSEATSAVRAVDSAPLSGRLDRVQGSVSMTFTRPLPSKPFRWQLLVPCRFPGEPAEHPEYAERVPIRGGCWRQLARKPPCGADFDHEGSCYEPIHKDPRPTDDPSALQPE
jgi:hypothetical protein